MRESSKLHRRALERCLDDLQGTSPYVNNSQNQKPDRVNSVKLPKRMTREELQAYKQMAVVKERRKRLEAKKRNIENIQDPRVNAAELEITKAKEEAVRRHKERVIAASYQGIPVPPQIPKRKPTSPLKFTRKQARHAKEEVSISSSMCREFH